MSWSIYCLTKLGSYRKCLLNAGVAGIFILGIILVNKQVEKWIAATGDELHHRIVNVSVANRQDRWQTDGDLDIDWIARHVVEWFDVVWLLHQHRAALVVFPGKFQIGSNHVLSGLPGVMTKEIRFMIAGFVAPSFHDCKICVIICCILRFKHHLIVPPQPLKESPSIIQSRFLGFVWYCSF